MGTQAAQVAHRQMAERVRAASPAEGERLRAALAIARDQLGSLQVR